MAKFDPDDRKRDNETAKKTVKALKEKRKKKFDPQGGEFDIESARKAGIKRDASGHFQSRIPETGLILKGAAHPTFFKTIRGERKAGFTIRKRKDERLISTKGRIRNPSAN